MKKVLVTGANGHLGYNLTRLLLEKGYKVRASVRDKNDSAKTAHLEPLGAEIVESDILKPDTLKNAVRGMDGVFHTAAAFNHTSQNPDKEVRQPIVTGSSNLLNAAKEEGLKKVVYTSSVVAVGTVADGEAQLTEKDWNDRAIEPYAAAKTEAEKLAWDFAGKNELNMVAVLPSVIIGPGFYRHTPSTLVFEMLLRGQVPVIMPFHLDFVDVRDVARAHIMAYENDRASGRYIVSNSPMWFGDVFQEVQEIDPKIKIPKRHFPKSALGLIPLLDWFGNKVNKTPRSATRKLVREYGGRMQHFSNAKAKEELGWTARPFRTTLSDTLSWVRKTFLNSPTPYRAAMYQ